MKLQWCLSENRRCKQDEPIRLVPKFFSYQLARASTAQRALQEAGKFIKLINLFLLQGHRLRSGHCKGKQKPRYNHQRADSQQWAIYLAGLLHNAGVPHQDTIRERPVVKAVRYGIPFLCLPSEKAVELCDRVIAKQEGEV